MSKPRQLLLTKDRLRYILAAFWLLDGCLQLQPHMFSAGFIRQVINPATLGQPSWLLPPIHLASHIFLLQPAIFNALIALIQLAIGGMLLFKRSAKIGLAASVLWGVVVWYLGEALGGVVGGTTSLLMGAPGAGILYSLLSLGAWPDSKRERKRPAAWLTIAWFAIWAVGAYLQTRNQQNMAAPTAAMLSAMTAGMPHWLAVMDQAVATFIRQAGNLLLTGLIALETAIGLLVFLGRVPKVVAVVLGCLLAACFWVVGQSFGGFYSGYMTDLNTAPLIIVLGLAVLSTEDTYNIKKWI